MREIKFKVFCDTPYGIERGVHDATEIDFEEGTVCFNAIDPHDKESVRFCYPLEEAKLIQYTGLKDKNGVEIYEGDILRWWIREHICMGEVTNDFCEVKSSTNNYYVEKNDFKLCEVVGNIYKNKELLQ